MLTLTLEAPRPRRPPADGAGRRSSAPPLRTWWEDDGEVGVVDVARVGRFRFHREDGGVVAVPGPGVPHDTVDAAFAGTVLPLVLQARGEHLLHASAVVTEAGVAAFCGRSGAGKSTLAHGLARRGLPQWGDDAVLLRAGGESAAGNPGPVRTFPLPWRARLRPDVRRHPGNHARQAPTPANDPASSPPASRPLWRIYTVTRRADLRSPRAVPLAAAAALPPLVDNAYRFDGAAPRTRALLVTCLDLAAAVPVFRLELPDDLGGLHPTLDAVAGLLRRAADGWHTACPL